jgi:ribosomal protein S18 acetylase RimI-like enzyme
MSPRLRAYREEDFAALMALWNACGLLKPHHDPRREVSLVQHAANAEIFLAFLDDRLAGSIQIGHDGHRAWMYRLGVAPDLRGRGIARALIGHAESWSIARGLPKLMLMIRDGNESVMGLYRRLGYEQEPRLVMSKSFSEADRPGPSAMLDVVVTFLEMNEAPARPTVPPPAGLHLALLRAERPDVAFYRFLYERVGDPWLWHERKQWDDARLAATLADPKVEVYVLYVAGAPAGYVEIDRRPHPDAAIACFGVMPEHIGGGLGWYLLNAAIDAAWSAGPRRLLLESCTLDHPRALQRCQRAGFTPYRQEHRRSLDPRLAGLTPMRHEPRQP